MAIGRPQPTHEVCDNSACVNCLTCVPYSLRFWDEDNVFRLNSSALPIALYLYMPTCGINEVFRKIKLEREDWREKTPLSQQT